MNIFLVHISISENDIFEPIYEIHLGRLHPAAKKTKTQKNRPYLTKIINITI